VNSLLILSFSMAGRYVYLNGKQVESSSASISIFDYGFLFGAGVYDVALIYAGKLFQATLHLDRFFRSASELNIPIKESKEELWRICEDLIGKNEMKHGIVYLQATYGSYGKRSHKFPAGGFDNPTIVMFTQDLPLSPEEFFISGVDVVSEPEIRWTHGNIKTLLLLPAVMVMNKLPSNAVENVFYDEEKRTVRECAASNIFCVKDGTVYTPPLSRYILPGVERQTIVNLAKENNIPLKEEDFSIEFLKSADEVFISSTTKEVLPVKRVDDAVVLTSPGPATKQLMKLFVEYVEKQLGVVHHKRKFLNLW